MRIRFLTNKMQMKRRVAGYHDIRLDGISDLLFRANGASVLDIGCNRGLVSFEFANNGAARVHGCDYYEEGVRTAREIFADLASVESKFEVVDLTGGPKAVTAAFGNNKYEIVLFLAVYHKLKRQLTPDALQELIQHLGERATRYFAWRGATPEDEEIEPALQKAGLTRVQFSRISTFVGPAAIWERNPKPEKRPAP